MARDFVAGLHSVDSSAIEPTADIAAMKSRTLLLLLTLVGFALAIAGLILNLGGFLAQVVAGAASLVLGAVLAVALIDQLLQQRRREQWQIVRDAIRQNTCEGVVDIATSFALAVGGEQFLGLIGPEDSPLPQPSINGALNQLVADVATSQTRLAAQLDPLLASSRHLYEEVSLKIARFGGTTTTRVIALGAEPQLVARLLAFERAGHQWESWIETVEQWGAPDTFAWQHAIATLRAGVELYTYFLTQDA